MLDPIGFAKGTDDTGIETIRLGGQRGLSAVVTSYGARLVALYVPRDQGPPVDVVLGYPDLEGYLTDRSTYFGAIAGRYANRIANARFWLGGREYQLPDNDGHNSLHGGLRGFDACRWTVEKVSPRSMTLALRSQSGDQGYPGTLDVRVAYSIEHKCDFRIDYWAQTDALTVLNLTNHAYFNLSGEGSSTIEDHELSIAARDYTPVRADLIPTGVLASVEGTPFDFRAWKRVGEHIDAADPQISFGHGYDHNFAIDGRVTAEPRVAARLRSPLSGITMAVLTTEPGLQFYTGNYLDGSRTGKSGRRYGRRSGLCLETQHFPDSPNQPSFPTTALQPGHTFRSTTIFRFCASA